jgi:hypothetical protein
MTKEQTIARNYRYDMREIRERFRQRMLKNKSNVQTQERNHRANMREIRARNRRIGLIKDAMRKLQEIRLSMRLI